ncbi:BadF/BadG/BcrA/BcrD ATPase family protein [Prevotella sp. 885]|uniref:BadF/BadG/BcrA/BcrD ATPase family protein n=1 Tax=Prevotella sp. 885 TaxID=2022527 RepID=UPI0020CEFBF8|nr:BadF/BadG/BcrA/BcrD ATPase family protein [Prevotella sp. 885]
MITLIVDSGSTKTSWCFAFLPDTKSADGARTVTTEGLNPAVMSAEEVEEKIAKALNHCLQSLSISAADVDNVFFYGAGCIAGRAGVVSESISSILVDAKIYVADDLLGAARALCGHKSGIACILGTGSNSCLYDGENIVAHTPALGYVLGDEGSGAVLGRKFLNAVLKQTLPENIRKRFLQESGLDMAEVINRVYRSPAPNRFLASMSKYIHGYLDEKEVRDIVIDNFEDFIRNNILAYGDEFRTINVVGSIAYHYKEQLTEAASRNGFQIGKIIKSPIEGLIEYHMS